MDTSQYIEADAPAAPNTGRILDYWLGGSHHYPIDVVGAKQFESIYAGFPAVFGSLRKYIGRVSKQIEQAGIDQFMVLGAGLPTCGNVHEAVPASKVLYTDIDMDNVRLGKRILAGNPDVDYTYCDATDLSSLAPWSLRSPADIRVARCQCRPAGNECLHGCIVEKTS